MANIPWLPLSPLETYKRTANEHWSIGVQSIGIDANASTPLFGLEEPFTVDVQKYVRLLMNIWIQVLRSALGLISYFYSHWSESAAMDGSPPPPSCVWEEPSALPQPIVSLPRVLLPPPKVCRLFTISCSSLRSYLSI